MASHSSGETNGLGEHCRQIARRFLLTAVVVDDELSVVADPQVHSNLSPPDPRASRQTPTQADLPHHPSRPLKVDPITWSFARQGMVCGVVTPKGGPTDVEALANAVARADIVILDWRLSRKTGDTALPLLEHILRADQTDRFRLIAVYTGEPDRQDIRGQITDSLNALGQPNGRVRTSDSHGPIDYRACRIVVYGKPGPGADDLSMVVKEEDLANRLIADVAEMARGLLPSLVLTALAAVRENVYRVLNRFGPDLDPAFLAHRACLPRPSDSEEHMVEQIASELHGIMDEAVGRESPAGIDAIDHWLAARFADGHVQFHPKGQAARVPAAEVRGMMRRGFDQERPGLLGKGQWHVLSHGLAANILRTEDARELDRRLAHAMSFRQVLEGTWRRLSMGTVVRQIGSDDTTLLCVTPRCDSVRLTKESSFLFVPLSEPKSDTLQIVVPIGPDQYRRMTISENPSRWLMKDFKPELDQQCVVAERDELEGEFTFEDVGGEKYTWVGELKAEFAQSIAQTIAKRMSRLPLNKSEWLRRSERIGQRGN